MFISRARFEYIDRKLKHAEAQLAEKDAANQRLISQLQHHRDEHPDTPVAVQPAVGDARLVQLLALSEQARRALDAQLVTLTWANSLQEKELHELRKRVTVLEDAAALAEEGAA